MRHLTPSEFRKNVYMTLQEVVLTHEPLQVSGKHGDVVLVPLDDWESIQETLYLQAIPGYKASLLEASQEDLDQYKKKLPW